MEPPSTPTPLQKLKNLYLTPLRQLRYFFQKLTKKLPLPPCLASSPPAHIQQPLTPNNSTQSILLQITPLATSLFLLVHTPTYSLELVTNPHPLLTSFPLRSLPQSSLHTLAHTLFFDLNHILNHTTPHELLATPHPTLKLLSTATHQTSTTPCKSPIHLTNLSELTPSKIYRALLLGC